MPKIRGLRTIKKEILKLIETYVDKAEDLQAVRTQMVPQLLDSVLVDYNRNVPGARDAEVLKAMTAIIAKLSALMEDQIPIIMENVFECTLEMINKDFSEFPEHRVEFFNLLRAINLHCFPGKCFPNKIPCCTLADFLSSSSQAGQSPVQVRHRLLLVGQQA